MANPVLSISDDTLGDIITGTLALFNRGKNSLLFSILHPLADLFEFDWGQTTDVLGVKKLNKCCLLTLFIYENAQNDGVESLNIDVPGVQLKRRGLVHCNHAIQEYYLSPFPPSNNLGWM